MLTMVLAHLVARSSAPSSNGPCNPITMNPSGGAIRVPPLFFRPYAIRLAAFPKTLVSILSSLVSKDATLTFSRAFFGILLRNSFISVDGLPPQVGEPTIRRSTEPNSLKFASVIHQGKWDTIEI